MQPNYNHNQGPNYYTFLLENMERLALLVEIKYNLA